MSEMEREDKIGEIPGRTEDGSSPDGAGDERSPDMIRRDFIKRFGAYSAGTCAGLFVLMSPATSKVQAGSEGGP